MRGCARVRDGLMSECPSSSILCPWDPFLLPAVLALAPILQPLLWLQLGLSSHHPRFDHKTHGPFTTQDNAIMTYQQRPEPQPPQLGATFVPGGFDDYYMPAPQLELVSPSPQR